MQTFLQGQSWGVCPRGSISLDFLIIFTPDNFDVFFISGVLDTEGMVDSFEGALILGTETFGKGERGSEGSEDLGFDFVFVVMGKVEG